jgi:tight adherence protein B
MLGMSSYFFSRASSARRNLAFLDRVHGNLDVVRDDVDLSEHKPARYAKNKTLQAILRGAPFVDDLAQLLEQSGMATSVASLLGRMFVIGVAGLVGAVLWNIQLAGAFFLGIFACILPLLHVLRARQLRAIMFESQLPNALELIGLYLRSGRSLPQAFLGATEEILPPARDEFLLAAEEYRLGRPLDSSLKRLAQKYPTSIGFRLFAIAVTVLGQTGGNLVEVLERIKKTLDAGVSYGLRLKALTGESRMSAWILGCLPGLFLAAIAVLNPLYINTFFDYALGRLLFGIFLGLWAAGGFWIRQLMQSKVV